MKNKNQNPQFKTVASDFVNNAYLDFMLSRQAMMCTDRTIDWYRYILGKIIDWLVGHNVNEPEQISSKHIRAFLAEMAERGCADSYMHTYARAMKTFSRFMLDEEYISKPISFPMPKIAEKRLRVYDENQVRQILTACQDNRETAFIRFMVDTGLRNAEVRNLKWRDIEISSGVVRIHKGKGRKSRIVIVGLNTRRALLKYRREVDNSDSKPLFQTETGKQFTESGLRSWLCRLGKRAKIHITPHALRRTFATLSLKAGMNVFQLQGLLGHSTLEITRHYVTLLDEDLIDAHQKHGPIDNLLA
ncbi:MAG: tyrosine-type recombinase/integrase [Anaerolineaceae bacterium]|nr:tyrosine-type recombinase/integrase [Anaerolineaceae bacterium]